MNSFISWVGGKKLLRKQIVAQFPKDKLDRYIDVFGGAAWVLLAEDKHAPLEIYNDFDKNLVNLFRCVKHHEAELQRTILPLNSRELFYTMRQRLNMPGQTDIQRAADFYMLIRTSFGSDRRSFGCNKKSLQHGLDLMDMVSERFKDVVIENRSFEAIIKTYDRPGALFYCDPPYFGAEDFYDVDFNEVSHQLLRQMLGNIKGRFVLSYNDHPRIRELYEGFTIIEVTRTNNLSNHTGDSKLYAELIIKNF